MPKTKDDNRQVLNTRLWISQSLLSLMEEKPYVNITIQEIAKRADIDRRTFYRHYATKEDVLDRHFKLILRPYLEHLMTYPKLNEYEMSVQQFTFLSEHVPLLCLLKRNGLYGYLVDLYQRTIHIYRNMRGLPPADSEEDRFRMAFKTGGLWNIVSEWLEDDPVKSPDEMARIICNFMENGIMSSCEDKI